MYCSMLEAMKQCAGPLKIDSGTWCRYGVLANPDCVFCAEMLEASSRDAADVAYDLSAEEPRAGEDW